MGISYSKWYKKGIKTCFAGIRVLLEALTSPIIVLIEYNQGTLRAKWHNFSRSLKNWRNEYKSLRKDTKPVFVFDEAASAQLLQDDALRALVVDLAGQGISQVSDIGSALGLGGEVPSEPELLFVLEPYKRVKKQYERAVNESRWDDAAKLFKLIEHYERSSYQGPAADSAVQVRKVAHKARLSYQGRQRYAREVEDAYWRLLAKINEREDILH